ncbi:beta-1,6-glucan synthase [Thauera sp. WH-1]|uniref:glycoside hydrolase family 17 protein n=1 Tax=Thauera sp. WH-1 TaxID=3398230 RepID=UPI0039FBE01C
MLPPRTDRRALWLSLLASSVALLAVLFYGLAKQSRPMPMHDLQLAAGEKLKCVSYAPYHRPGQTPLDADTRIERAQIAADLAALAEITDCVRLYSVNQGLEQVPEVARTLGLKVLLGAWIGYDTAINAVELERAITLANAHADVVRALVVGNEVLLRRERSEDEMRALIRHAKARSQVPVTYADVWEFWTRHDSLAAEVDFVTVHILPFWEDDPVDIDLALAHVADTRRTVARHFGDKPILIGETGWPSAGRQREHARPSRVNQARYIREFVHRAHDEGWDYNLIEAIDQPWKRRLEGTVGGHWGMLEADSLYPKFPLAGPVAERESLFGPIGGALIGGLLACLLAATGRRTHLLRVSALTATGAVGGVIAVLHWEHAHLAYRDALEWSLLGGVAALSGLVPLVLARWHGEPIPDAARARHILWTHTRLRSKAPSLGLLRGLLLFSAAVAALLLWVDPRYRDFPTLLYLGPALVFGVIGWWRSGITATERSCAAVIAIGVIGRWSTEMTNPQAIAWLLTGLALALPVLLVRAHQHEQR